MSYLKLSSNYSNGVSEVADDLSMTRTTSTTTTTATMMMMIWLVDD